MENKTEENKMVGRNEMDQNKMVGRSDGRFFINKRKH